jgi:hypothetical protein
MPFALQTFESSAAVFTMPGGGVTTTADPSTGIGVTEGFGANDEAKVTIKHLPLFDHAGHLLAGYPGQTYCGKYELIFACHPDKHGKHKVGGDGSHFNKVLARWGPHCTTLQQVKEAIDRSPPNSTQLYDLNDFPYDYLCVKTTGSGNEKGLWSFTGSVTGYVTTQDIWSVSNRHGTVQVFDRLYIKLTNTRKVKKNRAGVVDNSSNEWDLNISTFKTSRYQLPPHSYDENVQVRYIAIGTVYDILPPAEDSGLPRMATHASLLIPPLAGQYNGNTRNPIYARNELCVKM